MDKVEFGIKMEQIEKLKAQKDYVKAAEVADTIEWRKVKKWSELLIGEEIYEKAGRIKEARNLCVYAYNRNLGGRSLVYKLTELSIDLKDLEEADDLYNEFVEMAPHDMSRYVLLYKLNKARGVSLDRLIQILEEYKENELDEHYEYELAVLYAKANRIDECIKECDDLILWFNDGLYVHKALELKKQYTELTHSQEEKLKIMREFSEAGLVYEASLAKYEQNQRKEAQEMTELNSDAEAEISVAEKDYSIYDTQNIQAELARSMADVFEEIEKEKDEEYEIVAPVVAEPKAESEEEIEEETEDIEVAGEEDEPSVDTAEIPNIFARVPINENLVKMVTEVKEDVSDDDEEDIEENLEKDVEENIEVEKPARKYRDFDDDDDDEDDFESIVQSEVAATTEPISYNVVEMQVGDEDEVDEPTREIIINTHRWNQVKCVMEEIGLDEDEEIDEADEVLKPTVAQEPVQEEVKEEEIVPVQMELELEEEEEQVINGQMDLMFYLEHMDELAKEAELEAEAQKIEEPVVEEPKIEEPAAIEQEESDSTEDKFEQIIKDTVDSGVLDQDEESAVDAAVDELTKQLMAEVAADFEKEEMAAPPVEHVEADDDEISEDEQLESEEPESAENEEEDEEDSEDGLGTSSRKYIEKYMFMNGMREAIEAVINGKKVEVGDGTSRHGNIVVMGKKDTDKTDFAINLIKAIYAEGEQKELRIAKTTAEVLNKKGIASTSSKVKGTTFIIEHADKLSKEVADELNTFMETDTAGMLVIFTGEEYLLKKLFASSESLKDKFDYQLELKHYTVKELVDYACNYAEGKGYLIDEKATAELYAIFDELEGDDGGREIEHVKKIVDKAIMKTGKSPINMFGKKKAKPVILKEKHFAKILG